MVTRLEIGTRPDLQDPRGEGVARKIGSFLGIPVKCVRTREVYRIDASLEEGEAERVRIFGAHSSAVEPSAHNR